MNCREFENIVNDLARAKSGMGLMDVVSRAASRAHAEICGRCAARLADERALSAGLKSLAADDEGKAAPPSVEAALLKAFHARSSNRPAPRLPVRSKTWMRWAPNGAPIWAMVAAAAILIVFGFIAYRAIRNEPRKANEAHMAQTPPPSPVVNRQEQVEKRIVATEPPNKSRAERTRRGNRPRPNKPFIIDSVTTYAKNSEYATDFFSLSYDNQEPMERGEVIRVQMPRSALVAFGLAVNVERADTLVKADLLVGEDGTARAIRFVR
jgi:hypothetical protein